MLRETDRAKAGRKSVTACNQFNRPAAGLSNSDALKEAPTLADLGISKHAQDGTAPSGTRAAPAPALARAGSANKVPTWIGLPMSGDGFLNR